MALPFRYNVLSLLARPTNTIASIGLVAIVIAAFAYLQAVTDSAFNTMTATGDPKTVIVLSQAADTETVSILSRDQLAGLDAAPSAVRDGSSALISPEIVTISSASTRDSGDVKINTCVRGVDWDKACKAREDRVRLVAGRTFQSGLPEVVVGETAAKQYVGCNIGDTIQLGTRDLRDFTIVGVFSTGGTAADSEIWSYVETLRDIYGRDVYSSARMRVEDDAAARDLIAFAEGPQMRLKAKTERDYFTTISTQQIATQVLSVAMIIIMGVAAAFAVANTMYSAVAGRTREIGMLRAIGFARVSILMAFVLEGLLLAVVGGAIGCALSLACNGMQKNMLPQTFTMVSYTLAITPRITIICLIVAATIGLFGSFLPAWRAALLRTTDALRES